VFNKGKPKENEKKKWSQLTSLTDNDEAVFLEQSSHEI